MLQLADDQSRDGLGIDNLIFIAILADKLPPHQGNRARLSASPSRS
jgi:hypothetical protein